MKQLSSDTSSFEGGPPRSAGTTLTGGEFSERNQDPFAPVGDAGTLVNFGDHIRHNQPAHFPIPNGPTPVMLQPRPRQSLTAAG
ncbi:hypothetical protein MDUV_28630 [Mycolicibacterium duvalii]|uniref:Uncharacterized protein n=1 Tax=Mycolicibacterium duvalii TaxID=39688 RepID=A0A7I7K1R8_9MYCO|nr:hypothetical protein MDUV_28630 [Mycolicibacterium duvalii]